jgi:hypothetical protein
LYFFSLFLLLYNTIHIIIKIFIFSPLPPQLVEVEQYFVEKLKKGKKKKDKTFDYRESTRISLYRPQILLLSPAPPQLVEVVEGRKDKYKSLNFCYNVKKVIDYYWLTDI